MASRATRASVTLAAVAVGVVAILAGTTATRRPVQVTRSEHRIAVAGDRFTLDATLYVPTGVTASAPAPAVLLAHGFGGSKRSVASDALALARDGYVVVAWSARGFGRSGGRIALNAPDAEITDVTTLVDWLAERAEVRLDRAGDPRVGMTGASYGGGATLLAAAVDDRIDAIVPIVAWHSLVGSLAPNAAGDGPGVFKQQWASLLFTAGAAPIDVAVAPPVLPATRAGAHGVLLCGRFTRAICDAYRASAEAGALTADAVALLGRADLDDRLDQITAPALLIQAQADTLFPLDQSLANARGIAAAGTAVKLVWIPGGHAVGATDGNAERVRALTQRWFDRWLRDDPSIDTGPVFEWTDRASGVVRTAPDVGEPDGSRAFSLSADGHLVDAGGPRADEPDGGVVAWTTPPGGEPSALTSLPGLGAIGDVLPPTDVPGQHVAFETAALGRDVQVLGAPMLRVRIDATTTDAVVFAKVYDVAPDGLVTLPQQAVAPARLRATPATTTLELPTLAHRFRAGHRMRLVLSATDRAYANPRAAGVTRLTTGTAASLTLPTVPPPAGPSAAVPLTVLAATLALSAAATAVVTARRRRRGHNDGTPDDAADAVVVHALRKAYPDGLVAVDGIELRVQRGQVFGLLGPNGAGKTTTLRMLLGLIAPTAGSVELLGRRISPGHPILRHVGALVEGPGFAPYLSGRDNLVSYWRAGGRPVAEAHLDDALSVAALGDAIDRPVRTYSHGMRQRLGIAQALLGGPELLVLDEPTDGLDPGQIRGMRELLAGLASGGRTVLISSHLLAEVEQVCTHVAVMNSGRVVAAGPVAELAGDTRSLEITTDDRQAAQRVLADLLGAGRVRVQGPGLVIDLDGRQPPELVEALVAAGVPVRTVTPRRRLEDAFLRLVETDRR